MRHKRIGRKLGVTTKHRKSMLRNMVTDLFRNDSLKTTDTRAKEIRRVAEKMITMAKQGTLHKRRQAGAYIRDNEVLRKLFEELAERFKDRPGGYTRITKLGFRRGDNTPISIIELVEEEYKPKKKKKAKAAPKKQEPKATAKAKSSKKESAEELGLIDKEEKKTPGVLAAETIEVSEEETAPEETPEEEKVKEPSAAEAEETPEAQEESSDTPEAKAQEVSEEAEAQPEEQIEVKAEESSGAQAEDNTEAEEDKETEKKEDE